MLRTLATALALILSVAVVLFAVANRQPVTVDLSPLVQHVTFEVTVPLYAVMFAAVAFGLLVGRSLSLIQRPRRP